MYYISKIKNYCKSTYNHYFPENQYDFVTQPRTPLLPEAQDALSKNITNINSSSSSEDTFPYTVNILEDPIQSSPSLLTDNFSYSNNIKNNKISTSKYTPLNCIPKIIIEQFSKTANVYFLIIAIFQTVKEISNSNGKPVILFPLFIVISVNGVKNFYEDWKRRKSDEEENSKQCCILNHSTGKFEIKTWESIAIGDVIKISNNEFIPADCVIVSSSEQNGVCYIETKSIDGETNLKYKKANTNINAYYVNSNSNSNITDEERLMKFNGCKIKTQLPNEHIYEFSGKTLVGLYSQSASKILCAFSSSLTLQRESMKLLMAHVDISILLCIKYPSRSSASGNLLDLLRLCRTNENTGNKETILFSEEDFKKRYEVS